MNVQLPHHVLETLNTLVSQGRFVSAEEACLAGVELLLNQERLKAAVSKGIVQLENGQWSDEETVFAEVDAEIARASAESRELHHSLSMGQCDR